MLSDNDYFQIKMSLRPTSYMFIEDKIDGIEETDSEYGIFLNGKKYALRLRGFGGIFLCGIKDGSIKILD